MQRLARAVVRVLPWWLVAVFGLGLAPAALAQAVPGGGGWSPGPDAAGDNTYQGFIDQPADGASIPLGTTLHVSGWMVDTAADGWAGLDDVQVLNGGTVLAHGSVGLSRPDVAQVTGNPYWASSGFDVQVPTAGLAAGPANLTVALHTPAKGSWTKPLNVTIAGGGAVITSPGSAPGLVLTIIAPAVGEDVIANHNGIIRGTAYDTRTRANLGAGVDRVQVYLDAARGAAGSQELGTVYPTDNTWSITWQPTDFDHVPHHVLWVYAHSSVTGEERLVNQEINIIH